MKIFLLLIICTFGINSCFLNAQNNINVVLHERGALNIALNTIEDAKALNFGDYIGQNGLNAWYLNLDEAYINIKPNNSVIIENIKLTGGVDLQLWLFGQTLTGQITGQITGEFSVTGDENDGYSLHIISTGAALNYSGSLQSVVELVNLMEYDISAMIPNIEISLGTSLLPEMVLEFFKSGIPQITTNESEIILTFEVLFDDLEIKNKIIKTGENIDYRASNSILINGEFSVEQGATFSAEMIPKN